MKKKLLVLLTGIALCAVLLLSTFILGKSLVDSHNSEKTFGEIQDLIVTEIMVTESEEKTSTRTEVVVKDIPVILTPKERYSKIYESNDDFVGWISIENTAVNILLCRQ